MDKNFHPIRHLLEKHRYTTFDDLKLGLIRLKREVERNDQAPIQFMRDNLDAFLQCYDNLSDILDTGYPSFIRRWLFSAQKCTLYYALATPGKGRHVKKQRLLLVKLIL